MSILQEVAVGEPDPIRATHVSGSTLRVVASRVLRAVVTLVFVVIFNFFLFRMLPGDPIGLYTRGRNQDAEQLLELRRALNKPLLEQFLTYIRNPFDQAIDSTRFSRPVWEMIGERVWPTILLLGTAIVVASLVGIWIGIRAGWKPGGRFDRMSTGATLMLYSMPEFWLGMMLLIVFSVGAFGIPGFFPVGGMSTPGVDTSTPLGWLNVLWHLVLPCTTLILIYLADYALVMRASLIDERKQEYLTLARAKGLRDAVVRKRHAVPNALLPTITLIFLSLGFVVTGAITVETVFSWPGLGLLTYEALRGPDIPLLQAIFLMFSIAVIVANLIAELLYVTFDPRVRS
ncbi:MAG: ABC transporter permease subunit [Actinobacteria bacterium]|nr:ABC transporter permease subunit [Actinomycetota bacterium]